MKKQKLKSLVLNDDEIVVDNKKKKPRKNTGSTEGTNNNQGENVKSKAADYLNDINRWYKNNGKAAYVWKIDWTNKRLIYSYNNCFFCSRLLFYLSAQARADACH